MILGINALNLFILRDTKNNAAVKCSYFLNNVKKYTINIDISV